MKVIKGNRVFGDKPQVIVNEDPEEIDRNWKELGIALGRMQK